MTFLFENIATQPEDPILSIPIHFAEDTNPNKVNLGIGVYRDENNKPVVLQCVRKAEKRILDKNLNKEYLPIEGLDTFRKESLNLVYGKKFVDEKSKTIASYQVLGGMGGLRIGAEFLSRNIHTPIYIPNPTWGAHDIVFSYAGFDVFEYPYYDYENRTLDFTHMTQALKKMSPKTVVLLHACAHNPSGVDPTEGQWQEISQIFKERDLIPFFDLAYQGFKKDLESDAYAVRLFAEEGHEMLVANSYAKNFALYGERAGMLSIVTKSESEVEKIQTSVKRIIRGCYSTPPLQSARIVSEVLSDHILKTEWQDEVAAMRNRINAMRFAFMERLNQLHLPIDYSFLKNQSGFFSFCGLDPGQVKRLRYEYGIHMPENGRINVAGLNEHNLDYVTDSFKKVLTNEK